VWDLRGHDHPIHNVEHPGASGKRSISRAFGRMRTSVPRAIHEGMVEQARKVYG